MVAGLPGCLVAGCVSALVALLATAFPRQSAATRYAIWFVALLAVPVLSLLPFVLPAVTVVGVRGAAPGHVGLTHLPVLEIAWVLGVVWQLARVLRAHRRLVVLKRGASFDADLQQRVDALGCTRRVRVGVSDDVTMPMLAGLTSPTILLPRGIDVDDAILLHELAHARRRDDWTRALQLVVGALFFFHPAVWLIARRLDFERELACDQEAALRCGSADDYVTSLCRVGNAARSMRSLLATGMASSSLRLRVDALLDRPSANARTSPRALLVTLALLAACAPLLPKRVVVIAESISTDDRDVDGAAEYGRGMSLYNAGQYDEAAAHFQRSIDLGFEPDTSARWIAIARAGEAGRR